MSAVLGSLGLLAVAAQTAVGALTTQVVIRASERWTPVVNEVEVESGSALDFSTLCGTNAPAGSWGRVVARGGRFEFEGRPGESVRFYGVNLCMDANYLEADASERLVANLVRRGYNAIRLHHHDGGLVAGSSDSTTPNPERWEKLDALVAACARHGVYLTTDLYVSRPVTFRELGIDRDGSAKGFPFKELVLFHEGARSNYFAFARAFLGHRNPLTGRTYAGEPALAWLSLVNEGNTGHHGANYVRDFPGGAEKWRTWLARRKAEDPAHFRDIPESLPDRTWQRDSAHKSAFSLFAADLEIAFDAEVKRFLREEMGCRALVTSLNGGRNPPCYQLARQANFDYVDDHFYVDAPKYLGRRWQQPSRQHNGVPFVTTDKNRCDLGVKAAVFRRLLDRPFTVTEYNFVGPNEHRGVSGLLTGALAARQDWGGVWRFAWSHGDRGVLHPDQVTAGRFDLCADIVNRASERAAVCLFRRGDMAPLTRDLAWVLPERELRAVTAFSPYEPPAWAGAAWWCRLGTVVADAAPAGTWRSVRYEDAHRVTRGELVGDLPRQDDGVKIGFAARVFAVNTPRTCGIFAPQGRQTAGVLAVDFGTDEATVWASSLDGRPLADSARILVSHVTDVKNSGVAFADAARTTLLGTGELPLLMRVGKARVTLRAASGDWRAYRLAMTGRRIERIPVQAGDGTIAFEASSARGTIHYELTKGEQK